MQRIVLKENGIRINYPVENAQVFHKYFIQVGKILSIGQQKTSHNSADYSIKRSPPSDTVLAAFSPITEAKLLKDI